MHHIIAQAPCLVTDGGEWAADYVVRTERMQEDMLQVLLEMNSRRHLGVEEIDVPATLGQLTNVNKVHVACKGLTAPAAEHTRCARADVGRWRWASGAAAADADADAAVAPAVVSLPLASLCGCLTHPRMRLPPLSRSRSRRQLLARPLHLEASESYCSEAQYFLAPHNTCFDALHAYYEHDMRLFGLPSCLDAGTTAGAAAATASTAASTADDGAGDDEAAGVDGELEEEAEELPMGDVHAIKLDDEDDVLDDGAPLDDAETEEVAVADE